MGISLAELLVFIGFLCVFFGALYIIDAGIRYLGRRCGVRRK